jgi:hypothetical protein
MVTADTLEYIHESDSYQSSGGKKSITRKFFSKKKNKNANQNLKNSVTSAITAGSLQPSTDQILALIDSIEELTDITRKQVEITNAYQEQQQQKQDEADDKEEASIAHETLQTHDSIQRDNGFERSTVRLDGIEVYAVVSALTVASSIACLDAYGDIYKKGDDEIGITFSSMLNHTFMLANAVGIVSGLHATLIFSLVTMYGRTAVGLGRDLAFQTFFAQTGAQRYRGFQTFLWSLYAFTVQCIITIVTRMLPEADTYYKCAACLVLVVAASPVFCDTNFIISKAEVIFDTRGFLPSKRVSNASLIVPPAAVRRASRRFSTTSINTFPGIEEEEPGPRRSLMNMAGWKKSYRDNQNKGFSGEDQHDPVPSKLSHPQSYRDVLTDHNEKPGLPRRVEFSNSSS